jgi:hypothetical protein
MMLLGCERSVEKRNLNFLFPFNQKKKMERTCDEELNSEVPKEGRAAEQPKTVSYTRYELALVKHREQLKTYEAKIECLKGRIKDLEEHNWFLSSESEMKSATIAKLGTLCQQFQGQLKDYDRALGDPPRSGNEMDRSHKRNAWNDDKSSSKTPTKSSDNNNEEVAQFSYVNLLNAQYEHTYRCVRSVRFDISRFCRHKHTLHFDPPVSEAQAIRAVEAYLSLPMTEDYFAAIRDDLFHDDASWTDYRCRGDALTDAKYLERVSLNDDGQLSFSIGT